MIPFHQFRGKARRRCLRILRQVRERGCIYAKPAKGPGLIRNIQRLHRAGLVTACVSKVALWPQPGGYAFRELAVFATEEDALREYSTTLPRKGSR